MRRYLFALYASWSAAGCYYYRPLDVANPATGTYLSATLNDVGTDDLASTIGPDVRSVRGRVLTSDSVRLTFSVAAVSMHHGESITWKGETVTLNRGYLAGLEERRLARGRTILMIGATVLGVVTTYKVGQGIGLIPTTVPGGGGAK
jgi:hypothetical protein